MNYEMIQFTVPTKKYIVENVRQRESANRDNELQLWQYAVKPNSLVDATTRFQRDVCNAHHAQHFTNIRKFVWREQGNCSHTWI